MDLSSFAVPSTLAHLTPMLPATPARILEVGCGTGALAAGLGRLGHHVTGVDLSAEAVATAAGRGVMVIHADVCDVSSSTAGQFDVVLFTRALHHAEDLDGMLVHAQSLLAPGGQLVIEEFGWDRVDRAAAKFLHEYRERLVDGGLLDAEIPEDDVLDAWVANHQLLHPGAEMLAALSRVGMDVVVVETSMLWRLVDGRGGRWIGRRSAIAEALDEMRRSEEIGIAAGQLPAVGLLATVIGRPQS